MEFTAEQLRWIERPAQRSGGSGPVELTEPTQPEPDGVWAWRMVREFSGTPPGAEQPEILKAWVAAGGDLADLTEADLRTLGVYG